ncbi:hypothetical protein BDZ91DRAFT_795045 [Kalaharituber pfeilii]|nr:hypothetical protein BDZ91DRAFT_795045 [Kalaharituber pfeilii]
MPAATSATSSSSSASSSASPPLSTSTSPTCSTTSLPASDAILRADINRRLLESGELEKLTAHLNMLLRESGWREQTFQSCNRALRDPDLKIGNYNSLYAAVEREAIESVDSAIKIEVVKRIREVLEAIVEV